MAQEIRKVPYNWDHPTRPDGEFIPLRDGNQYQKHLIEYEEGRLLWENGYVMSDEDPSVCVLIDPECAHISWDEWYGERPDRAEYGPVALAGTKYGYQKYSIVSEGIPVTPVCSTLEKLHAYCEAKEAVRSIILGVKAVCEAIWSAYQEKLISNDAHRLHEFMQQHRRHEQWSALLFGNNLKEPHPKE